MAYPGVMFGPESADSYWFNPYNTQAPGLAMQLQGFNGFGGQMQNAMAQMAAINNGNANRQTLNNSYTAQVQQAALPAQYNAQAVVQAAQTNAEAEKYKALLAQQAQQSRTDAMLKALSGLTGSFGDMFKGGFPGGQQPYQSGVGGQQQGGTFNDPYRAYANSARTVGKMRGVA